MRSVPFGEFTRVVGKNRGKAMRALLTDARDFLLWTEEAVAGKHGTIYTLAPDLRTARMGEERLFAPPC